VCVCMFTCVDELVYAERRKMRGRERKKKKENGRENERCGRASLRERDVRKKFG